MDELVWPCVFVFLPTKQLLVLRLVSQFYYQQIHKQSFQQLYLSAHQVKLLTQQSIDFLKFIKHDITYHKAKLFMYSKKYEKTFQLLLGVFEEQEKMQYYSIKMFKTFLSLPLLGYRHKLFYSSEIAIPFLKFDFTCNLKLQIVRNEENNITDSSTVSYSKQKWYQYLRDCKGNVKMEELLQFFSLQSNRIYNMIGNEFLKLKNYKEAKKYYKLAAKRGYALSQYNLALCYSQFLKQKEKALYYFESSAQENFPEALIHIALHYKHTDIEKSIHYLKIAAFSMQNDLAFYNLGIIYRDHYKNYTMSFDYCKKAVSLGNTTQALYCLAQYYEQGIGNVVKPDAHVALELYKTCAANNFEMAQVKLGKYYLLTEKEKGVQYLQMAIQQHKSSLAMIELACYYWKQYQSNPSQFENEGCISFYYFKKVVEEWKQEQYPSALYHMALFYEKGFKSEQLNVSPNVDKAVKYYELAMKLGYPVSIEKWNELKQKKRTRSLLHSSQQSSSQQQQQQQQQQHPFEEEQKNSKRCFTSIQ